MCCNADGITMGTVAELEGEPTDSHTPTASLGHAHLECKHQND